MKIWTYWQLADWFYKRLALADVNWKKSDLCSNYQQLATKASKTSRTLVRLGNNWGFDWLCPENAAAKSWLMSWILDGPIIAMGNVSQYIIRHQLTCLSIVFHVVSPRLLCPRAKVPSVLECHSPDVRFPIPFKSKFTRAHMQSESQGNAKLMCLQIVTRIYVTWWGGWRVTSKKATRKPAQNHLVK